LGGQFGLVGDMIDSRCCEVLSIITKDATSISSESK